MQVAARYMLVQHRDAARELSRLGHITEREFEGLIEQNNMARVRLDYHPQTDQIPDRCARAGLLQEGCASYSQNTYRLTYLNLY